MPRLTPAIALALLVPLAAAAGPRPLASLDEFEGDVLGRFTGSQCRPPAPPVAVTVAPAKK